MILASLVFVLLAALLHVYIFTMESITWTQPAAWKRFSITSQEDADTTRPLAYRAPRRCSPSSSRCWGC